jgi:hypothetical protein
MAFPLLTLVACASAAIGEERMVPRSQAPAGFWDHWGDGKAEIDAYTLAQPRYGELRRGTAVLVYVTETFTQKQRVKSDGGHPDEMPVLKLHEVREFQTGIYDYDVTTSTFVVLDGSLPLGIPTKVSMGAQEWCGNVYEQLLFWPDRLERTLHSYFDGEGDRQESMAVPARAVHADALPILVRGLTGELVSPGGERTVPVLDRILDSRFQHEPPRFRPTTIRRAAEPESVEAPLGRFEVSRFDVETEGGPTMRFYVEVAAPHRLIGWARSDGEAGWIRGSVRTPYWQENHEGDEAMLKDLGLAVP